ncbi:MAG: C4-dicarboxylate ABC transporter substrate-binding protein, partial [Alphaproteobacteria bacterium]|nr:C4-dicarboxylate ABC transporter substrate-binding protein [Alphaproteobacteria bacterium]
MRKITMLCGALALAMFAAASADAKSTLRLGAVLAPTDPLMVAAQQFKRDVEARTNKEVEVLLFPNSQLGDTQNMMD